MGWEGISSDMVKCPICGYWTHWQNGREHKAGDAETQRRQYAVSHADFMLWREEYELELSGRRIA
jgi:hypothetical protein